MTSQSRRNRRTTARRTRLQRILCSLAGLAFLAGSADAQQLYGAGVRQRPASTFATPYPTTPTPGPVRTVYPQQGTPITATNTTPSAKPATNPPRPGGAAAPGAAGNVMYFHKSEGALAPDGAPDSSTVAMAAGADEPRIRVGVAEDLPAFRPGVPAPVTPPPATAIDKPIVAPVFDPVLPAQPFVPNLPGAATSANPVPPRVIPVPSTTPLPKEPGPEVTQLPPRSALFTIYNDAALEQIIRTSIMKQVNSSQPPDRQKTLDDMIRFPALKPTVPPGTPYVAKTVNLPPGQVVYESGYMIHQRLHFEEKNSERYGWDLGFAQPLVSTASFYKNVLLWPSSLASVAVTGMMDTNAGKCLPGSPTPYYLYPQGLTITGGVAEGLVITGLSFVIP